MATTTLSVKYRPLKIGFLVRDGSVEDLVDAAGINTLLWGGIHNPIIPISSTNKDYCSQLIKLFSVDVLFAVSHTAEIDEIIKNNPFLRDPGRYAENIFYEDWHTKKNILGYLDSINIVDYYWEKEFKNKPKRYKSNCVLVKWDNADACSDLFSILFGCFPTSYNLKDDFHNAFLRGLKSKEIIIPQSGFIDKNLAKSINPIAATTLELDGYGGTWRGDGLYVGSESDFIDLLYFWNLRASGLTLEFLPKDHVDRFDESIKAYIKRLDDAPNRNPNIEDWINIYYRGDHKDIQHIVKKFQGRKRFALSHCDEVIWNGLNIKPANYYFDCQQVLASVEKNYGRYSVSIALPEKKFISAEREKQDGNIGSQHLAVSIDPIGDFGYPEHTLKPPFIRALNEFYSREIEFDPWRVRSEREGIGVIIQVHDNSLSLYPIPHQKLIEKIFDLAGFRSIMSQAGLLAKQIIHGMREDNPLEACRVFKITGVRRLLASPRTANGKRIKWSEATKFIWENNFSKFENLYIESRDRKKLGTNKVFNYLVKKNVFSPKLNVLPKILRTKKDFRCRNCGLKEKILLKHFQANWECPFCGYVHFMPSHIEEDFQSQANKYWRFARSGLFAKENNQEGAIPVIVSLLTFARIFNSHKLIYSTSLNLKNSKISEIDFCILQYQRGDEIQFGIGECKSEGQKVNQQDIDNLKQVQGDINKLGIDCYIIISKMADIYEADELQLFRSLKNENRKFVILSNKELEPYHPYWEIDETDRLPENYALDMRGMHRNSLFLYLRENSNSQNG